MDAINTTFTTRAALLGALLLTACTEWNIEVTTMGGDTALTTVVTASVGDMSASDSAEDTGRMTTYDDPTTSDSLGMETTSSIDATTGDDTSTSTSLDISSTGEDESSTGDGRCGCDAAKPGFCEAVDVMCRTMGLDGTLSEPPGDDKCSTILPWCQTNGSDCSTCFLIDSMCRADLASPDAECVWVTPACENVRCEPPIAPLQDPPLGCARVIELSLHGPMSKRHLVIDTSTCPVGAELTASLDLHNSSEPMAFDLPSMTGCTTYGGANSAASSDPGGVVVPVLTPDLPISEFTLIVSVDGTLSDDVQIPDLLDGQQWKDAPTLSTPIRRHSDFSWRVAPQHVIGCVI